GSEDAAAAESAGSRAVVLPEADLGRGALLGARRGGVGRGRRRGRLPGGDIRDEGVAGTAADRRLEGARSSREIRSIGAPGDVCATSGVHGNAEAGVHPTLTEAVRNAAAAEVSGVGQSGAGWIDLRDEDVPSVAG